MMKQLYIQKASIIHDLNFWTKLLCLLLFLPLSTFITPIKLLPPLVIIITILMYASKIEFGKFWQNTKLYNISITIGIILLSLAFSSGMVTERLIYGIVLAVRFILLISFGVLFSMVTNPIEIPSGFLQAKLPHKYGITLMVGYRMIPLISQKISTIIDAQKARGAEMELSLKNIPKLPKTAVSLMVPILHSTLETSVRLSDTLISRGYNPDAKITTLPLILGINDLALFIISLLFLTCNSLRSCRRDTLQGKLENRRFS